MGIEILLTDGDAQKFLQFVAMGGIKIADGPAAAGSGGVTGSDTAPASTAEPVTAAPAEDIFPASDDVGRDVQPAPGKRGGRKPKPAAVEEVVEKIADAVKAEDYDLERDLRPLVKHLCGLGKDQQVREIFKKFGIVKLPELKPEQYAAFMADSEKLLP